MSEEKGNTERVASESQWRIAWRTLRQNPVGMFGLVGFALVVLLALLAPVLAPSDPTAMDFDHILESPSSAHPFGTDDLGRDILSRVLWGGRESLRVALVGVVIAGVGGVVVGLISGFYGGWVDAIIMRLVDVMFAAADVSLVCCDVHITHIPTPGDEAGLRRLGVHLTSDPIFATKNLFAS